MEIDTMVFGITRSLDGKYTLNAYRLGENHEGVEKAFEGYDIVIIATHLDRTDTKLNEMPQENALPEYSTDTSQPWRYHTRCHDTF